MKYKDIPLLRNKLLEEQNNICLLCKTEIINDAVLDHNHKTGNIRGVLHRGCNCLLGKIENNLVRNRINENMLEEIMINLINYIGTKRDEIHPLHTKKKRIKKKIKTKI